MDSTTNIGLSCNAGASYHHHGRQSGRYLHCKPVMHTRTKHIDIRYHYVREALAEGTINVQYCPKEIMVADILTKPLHKARFDLAHVIMGPQKLYLYHLMN